MNSSRDNEPAIETLDEPRTRRDMLRTGADSGTLSEAMERGAQLYEERAERAAVRAAAAAGGVMFVLAVIVVVAFAVHVVWGYYGQVWELSGY